MDAESLHETEGARIVRSDMIHITMCTELLHETAEHHGAFEESTPPHDWWDWYAPYLNAREQGRSVDEGPGRRPLHEGDPGIVRR